MSRRSALAAAARPLLVGLVLALGACSGGLRSNAPVEQAYVLRAAAPPTLSGPAGGPALRVARPVALPGLGTDRIMAVRAEHRLDAYAASRWAGPLPDVVGALLVETLRQSGRFASVEDDHAPSAADYLLRVELRHFEAEYPGASATTAMPPRLRVTLDCVVIRRVDGAVVASFAADTAAPAAANRMAAVIDGFEAATRLALAQLVEATATAVTGDAANAQKLASPVPSMNR